LQPTTARTTHNRNPTSTNSNNNPPTPTPTHNTDWNYKKLQLMHWWDVRAQVFATCINKSRVSIMK